MEAALAAVEPAEVEAEFWPRHDKGPDLEPQKMRPLRLMEAERPLFLLEILHGVLKQKKTMF